MIIVNFAKNIVNFSEITIIFSSLSINNSFAKHEEMGGAI